MTLVWRLMKVNNRVFRYLKRGDASLVMIAGKMLGLRGKFAGLSVRLLSKLSTLHRGVARQLLIAAGSASRTQGFTVSLLAALVCSMTISACKMNASSLIADRYGGSLIASAPPPEIRVVYPSVSEGSVLSTAATFIIGACSPGRHLLCNGQEVRMHPQGYFAHVVQLQPGENHFKLTEPEFPSEQRDIMIKRDTPTPPIDPDLAKLVIDTAQPSQDSAFSPGDIVELSVKATPGSSVSVQLGNRTVTLRSVAAVKRELRARAKGKRSPLPPNVNVGLDAAYGKMYQKLASAPPDLYAGFYKVKAEDHWENIVPKFILSTKGHTISSVATAHLTTVEQPILAQTKHDETIVRAGPGLSRLTPLPQGVRLLVDGWKGDQFRCQYSQTLHVWIGKDDIAFESDEDQSGPIPQSDVKTVNTGSDSYGADVIIPLTQRLPFVIEQGLNPSRLSIKVYGVTANTDWVSPIIPSDAEQALIDNVTWKQVADGVYEVTAHLKNSRQWGFYGDYQDSTLHLHIKQPPRLAATPERPLAGLSICVDPGHGGKETGAIGCGGIHEAELNLGIALKLRDLLERKGARVVMTRTTDTDVGLNDRVNIARAARVDVLLSVHNNALPDGRDPWKERGTSSYYYQPQAIELARALRSSVIKRTGLPDLATRWQNLALTRPSSQLSVLYEVAFVINPEEYAMLESSEGQQRAADGLLKGLMEYLGVADAPVQTGENR